MEGVGKFGRSGEVYWGVRGVRGGVGKGVVGSVRVYGMSVEGWVKYGGNMEGVEKSEEGAGKCVGEW